VSGPVAQEKQGIWMISVIGATLKKLRDDAHVASLSKDGTHIVFSDVASRDIWIMNSDGGQAHPLFKKDADYRLFKPTWFPNDKRIAYVKYRIKDSVVEQTVESRDLKGGDPVVLVSNPRLSDFCWAQNGRLLYSVNEPRPNQYDSNMWELQFDPETGKPKGPGQRLTDWTGFAFDYPEMTADGKRLVFLNDHSGSDVYVGELASGGGELKTPQRLTLDERLDWPGGWTQDGKSILFYSDRSGTFDIYKQGISQRNADPLVTSSTEKWAPQISPDGKWIVFMEWQKPAEGAPMGMGKLMRSPVGGGPSEAIMDIKGYPSSTTSSNIADTSGSFPSFRCPSRPADCVLAESDDKQLTFTAFDAVQGKKSELTKITSVPDFSRWDLSSDGSRVAISVFDYKAGDVQIVSLAGGAAQKLSVLPWTELAAVAWTADGQGLFLGSYSSRGTTIVRTDLKGQSKLLFKSTWDIFSLLPSPDGQHLAFGPIVTSANAWTIAQFPAQ
jgi:Tol biopolymer transport system component